MRKITRDGNINTIAGAGVAGHEGDGGPAINAQLAAPNSVVVDAGGNLYVADSGSRIRKITPDGTMRNYLGREQRGLLRR